MKKNRFSQDPLEFRIFQKPSHDNVTSLFDQDIQGLNYDKLELILKSRGGITNGIVGCLLIGFVNFFVFGLIAFFRHPDITPDFSTILIISVLLIVALISLITKELVWLLWLVIFIFIISVIGLYINKEFNDSGMLNFSASLFFIITILIWLYNWITPTKRLILNRVTGKMTYPSRGFGPHMTITFTSAKMYTPIIMSDLAVTGKTLFARNPYESSLGRGNYELFDCYPEEWWSFMVWFMDKNRPLPPGNRFDAYREIDYERRKKEGFPELLFPSNIDTPEYMEENKKE